MDVCFFYLLPAGPFSSSSKDKQGKQRKCTRKKTLDFNAVDELSYFVSYSNWENGTHIHLRGLKVTIKHKEACHKEWRMWSLFTHNLMTLHMCTCLWCVIIHRMLVLTMKCMHVWICPSDWACSALIRNFYSCKFHWFQLLPASGSWTGLCSSNTTMNLIFHFLFNAGSQARETGMILLLCTVAVTFVVTMHKPNTWYKVFRHYLWFLCRRWYCLHLSWFK